jgi:hypothetical protein
MVAGRRRLAGEDTFPIYKYTIPTVKLYTCYLIEYHHLFLFANRIWHVFEVVHKLPFACCIF